MHFLGCLASSLLLPLLIKWSRIQSLTVGILMFFTSTVLALGSTDNHAMLYRFSEVICGVGVGITLPMLHLYSAELFPGLRYLLAI